MRVGVRVRVRVFAVPLGFLVKCFGFSISLVWFSERISFDMFPGALIA